MTGTCCCHFASEGDALFVSSVYESCKNLFLSAEWHESAQVLGCHDGKLTPRSTVSFSRIRGARKPLDRQQQHVAPRARARPPQASSAPLGALPVHLEGPRGRRGRELASHWWSLDTPGRGSILETEGGKARQVLVWLLARLRAAEWKDPRPRPGFLGCGDGRSDSKVQIEAKEPGLSPQRGNQRYTEGHRAFVGVTATGRDGAASQPDS